MRLCFVYFISWKTSLHRQPVLFVWRVPSRLVPWSRISHQSYLTLVYRGHCVFQLHLIKLDECLVLEQTISAIRNCSIWKTRKCVFVSFNDIITQLNYKSQQTLQTRRSAHSFEWQVVCFTVTSCWTIPISVGVETRGPTDLSFLPSRLPHCAFFYFTLLFSVSLSFSGQLFLCTPFLFFLRFRVF